MKLNNMVRNRIVKLVLADLPKRDFKAEFITLAIEAHPLLVPAPVYAMAMGPYAAHLQSSLVWIAHKNDDYERYHRLAAPLEGLQEEVDVEECDALKDTDVLRRMQALYEESYQAVNAKARAERALNELLYNCPTRAALIRTAPHLVPYLSRALGDRPTGQDGDSPEQALEDVLKAAGWVPNKGA